MLGFHRFSISEHTDYRFGFQGQEADDEITSTRSHYTAKFWEYDSRIGKRWNVDPVTYPWQSSYATFNNNPLIYTDPLGLFGSRKEAKEHKRKTGLRGRVSKNDDGTFSINNKKTGTSTFIDSEFGLQTAALVTDKRAGLSSNPIYRNMQQNNITSFGRRPRNTNWYDRGNSEVGELAAAGLALGMFPMAIAISAPLLPELPSLLSKDAVLSKGAYSVGSQALTNDGRVNLVSVGTDALLQPGLGDVLGSAVELNINLLDYRAGFSTRLLGRDKSITEFGLEATTSMFFSTKLKVLDDHVIKGHGLLRPMIYLPNTISNYGLQRGLRENNDK